LPCYFSFRPSLRCTISTSAHGDDAELTGDHDISTRNTRVPLKEIPEFIANTSADPADEQRCSNERRAYITDPFAKFTASDDANSPATTL